jgi:hypothetical protein
MRTEESGAALIIVDKSVDLVDNLPRLCFSYSYKTGIDGEAIGYAHGSSAAHTVADFWITAQRVTTGKTI